MIRKVLTIMTLVLLLGSSDGWAQHRLEIVPFYGYQFGGKATTNDGDLVIADGDFFGLIVDIPLKSKPGTKIELSYSRQETKLDRKGQVNVGDNELFRMSVEYWQAGILKMLPSKGDKALPFGLVTLGATHYIPYGSDESSEWRFSFVLGLGANVDFNDRFGLRTQFSFLTTFIDGGDVDFGGQPMTISSDAVFQGNFEVGLIIKI